MPASGQPILRRTHHRRPAGRFRLIVLSAASLFCFAGACVRAEEYQLGHGLDLGPLNIAGYSNLVLQLPEGQGKSLSLEDFSLFVTAHGNWLLNPFAEAELTDLSLVPFGPSGGKRAGGGAFVLERLYNDSYLTASTTLRLGKMLTPVGEWNEIHAAPLVLSGVRPAVTYRNFGEYTTGAELRYADPFSRLPDAQFYIQPSGEFSERPRTITMYQYRTLAGAHVSFPLGLIDKIGLSFQQSKDVGGVDQSLYGVDYHYTIGKLTLQGEATFSDISHNGTTSHVRDTEWGAYAAASYALTDQWSVYGWYEGYADRTSPSVAHDLLFGVAYRPRPPIVIRAEFLQNIGGRPVNPTGLLASWAVLF